MNVWIAVLLAGVGCFGLRFGVVAVVDRWTLPSWLDRAAGFVMPASFAALCAAPLVGRGAAGFDPSVPVAAVITVLVGVRRSPSLAVVAGMTTIWCLELLGGLR